MLFEKLSDEAVIPHYQTKGSSGLDLHSIEQLQLKPFSRALVSTGLKVNLPEGFEGQIRSRSGLAAKHGIFVLNSPATIDQDYTGELKVILFNTSDSVFNIEVGDRIAQFVVAPVLQVPEYVLEIERASGGFGSTGK